MTDPGDDAAAVTPGEWIDGLARRGVEDPRSIGAVLAAMTAMVLGCFALAARVFEEMFREFGDARLWQLAANISRQ